MPDWNWQVELHEEGGFPVELAWVIAPPPGMTEPPPGWDARPTIKFVLVTADARRRGLGMRLHRGVPGAVAGCQVVVAD